MSSDPKAVLFWFRRDLRLRDHPGLSAAFASALAQGAALIPVAILDPETEALGAAPAWRLGQSLGALQTDLEARGAKLILRRGEAQRVLQDLAAETSAREVHWQRLYDPAAISRDSAVKAQLSAQGLAAHSHAGHLLHEPWTVETKTGGMYRVYTPYWNAVKGRDVAPPVALPEGAWPQPAHWPDSDDLAQWGLGARMQRGADIVSRHVRVGQQAALGRLHDFAERWIGDYVANRDRPAVPGTSELSAHLSLGEIGVRTAWAVGMAALEQGRNGAETFLKELVWREFAYHLMYHTPHLTSGNWRPEWDAFPWSTDEDDPAVLAWKQGRTGIPFVDAAMRQMYVTGTMHNRGRMIVASWLTKHMMTHWKIGMRWFESCLVDWDPASNAMGWQWSAGSGPDATPYFRVFNPVTQLAKFDPNGAYADQWIAEGKGNPSETALSFFEAVPRSWGLSPGMAYPRPRITPEAGRARALEAYKARSF